MKSPPLLSICISTYNRVHKSIRTVERILTCQDTRIEVVVNDNKSTDQTLRQLQQIPDHRLKVIENDYNLGTGLGFAMAISKARGSFIMICLDKDSIEPGLIPYLCDQLQLLTSVGMGFCDLEVQSVSPPNIYQRGLEAVQQMAYNVRHPSGYFFRRDIYLNAFSKYRYLLEEANGFVLECICAELCLSLDAAVINAPIIVLETKDEAKDFKSLTYKGSNAWFTPRQRFLVFKFFLSRLATLNLPIRDRLLIANRLFNEHLKNATIVFSLILNDPSLCMHYGIKPKALNQVEMRIIAFMFCSRFLFLSKYPSLTGRIRILVNNSNLQKSRVLIFFLVVAGKLKSVTKYSLNRSN